MRLSFALIVATTALAGCDSTSDGDDMVDPWPSTQACAGLDQWPMDAAQLELDTLAQLDDLRERGAECGDQGNKNRAPALRRRAALDCAARAHALDMATAGYVGRYDPDGRDETARAGDANYTAETIVQHIAAGPQSPEDLLALWLSRPTTCAHLADDTFSEVGLGLVDGVDDDFGTYWVIVLAQP